MLNACGRFDTARAARAERSIPALTTELKQACVLAERQLLERISEEVKQRSAVIRQRVLDVLDVDGNPDVLIRVELATILRHSGAVRAIESLRPMGYCEPGNAADTQRRARAILESWKKLTAEWPSER